MNQIIEQIDEKINLEIKKMNQINQFCESLRANPNLTIDELNKRAEEGMAKLYGKSMSNKELVECEKTDIHFLNFASDDTFALVEYPNKEYEPLIRKLYEDCDIDFDIRPSPIQQLSKEEYECILPALIGRYDLSQELKIIDFINVLMKFAAVFKELKPFRSVVGDKMISDIQLKKIETSEEYRIGKITIPDVFLLKNKDASANITTNPSNKVNPIMDFKTMGVNIGTRRQMNLNILSDEFPKTNPPKKDNVVPVYSASSQFNINEFSLTDAANDKSVIDARYDTFKLVDDYNIGCEKQIKAQTYETNQTHKIFVYIFDDLGITVAQPFSEFTIKETDEQLSIRKNAMNTYQFVKNNPNYGFRVLFEYASTNKEAIDYIHMKFHKKTFFNADELQNCLHLASKYIIFLSETETQQEKVDNREELIVQSFIRQYFKIDDDPNHKYRASDLYDLYVSLKTSLGIDTNSNFRNRLSKYLKSMGLQKKRMSDGYYYYGLVKNDEYSTTASYFSSSANNQFRTYSPKIDT